MGWIYSRWYTKGIWPARQHCAGRYGRVYARSWRPQLDNQRNACPWPCCLSWHLCYACLPCWRLRKDHFTLRTAAGAGGSVILSLNIGCIIICFSSHIYILSWMLFYFLSSCSCLPLRMEKDSQHSGEFLTWRKKMQQISLFPPKLGLLRVLFWREKW